MHYTIKLSEEVFFYLVLQILFTAGYTLKERLKVKITLKIKLLSYAHFDLSISS